MVERSLFRSVRHTLHEVYRFSVARKGAFFVTNLTKPQPGRPVLRQHQENAVRNIYEDAKWHTSQTDKVQHGLKMANPRN